MTSANLTDFFAGPPLYTSPNYGSVEILNFGNSQTRETLSDSRKIITTVPSTTQILTNTDAKTGEISRAPALIGSDLNLYTDMNTVQISSSQVTSTTDSPAPRHEQVKIELENADLWRLFHGHVTEMIVTKIGRRMFPTLRIRVTGLDPTATYAFYVVMKSVDCYRYKFQRGEWNMLGRGDALDIPHAASVYQHPDSPAPGQMWMQQPVSFHRIKLTNNTKMSPDGESILLHSMHKYQPHIYVLKMQHPLNATSTQMVAELSPPETQFIAVTAYQNNSITKLKVDHNPFAKGLRHGADVSSQAIGKKRSADEEASVPAQKLKIDSPTGYSFAAPLPLPGNVVSSSPLVPPFATAPMIPGSSTALYFAAMEWANTAAAYQNFMNPLVHQSMSAEQLRHPMPYMVQFPRAPEAEWLPPACPGASVPWPPGLPNSMFGNNMHYNM